MASNKTEDNHIRTAKRTLQKAVEETDDQLCAAMFRYDSNNIEGGRTTIRKAVRLFKANTSKVDCLLKQAEIENQNLLQKIKK